MTLYTYAPADHWFQELDACREPDFVLLGLIADDLELRGHPDAEAYRWCWKRGKWPEPFFKSYAWWKTLGNHQMSNLPGPIYWAGGCGSHVTMFAAFAALTPAFARCRNDGIDPWSVT